jgi:NAD(P)H-dependent glutamate synthase small subunit
VAKPTGFMEYVREESPKRLVGERIGDFLEIEQRLPIETLENQAARCMDCGIPYCHVFGCPVENRIPEWMDMVYRKHWRRALDLLHCTDNFPEFTGRVCPAPCESACTLEIDRSPVTIRQIELQIVERGWREGWIQPRPAFHDTGRKVAIAGSGPAGLVAAQQLTRSGHKVVVFEKADRVGGLLRYGIPDFKLEKWVIDRRLDQLRKEGVNFVTGVDVGMDLSARYLSRTYDAIIITAGAGVPRDLGIPGRNLRGIHFAMDFLVQQNRRLAGDIIPKEEQITAKGKAVVVIGGGDTGSDCIGTSRRQGAKAITQIELLPRPPEERALQNPWPAWPIVLRTSTSHEEGCDRAWSVVTKEFVGEGGCVKNLRCAQMEWSEPDELNRRKSHEISGSEFELRADLVLLSMGFLHVEHGPLVRDLNLAVDERGNLSVDSNFMTSSKGVFAAGDCVRGASLVVNAFYQGRQVSDAVHNYLTA